MERCLFNTEIGFTEICPVNSSYIGPAHVPLSTSRSSSICLCYQATWELQLLFDIFTIWDFVNADFPLLAVLGE